jgi:hypothetical protein
MVRAGHPRTKQETLRAACQERSFLPLRVEVIHGREREVDRRWLPPPLDLQMPLEVPGDVVPRLRILRCLCPVLPFLQPGTIRADMVAVGVLGPLRERRSIELSPAPFDRSRDRAIVAVLVSRSRSSSIDLSWIA